MVSMTEIGQFMAVLAAMAFAAALPAPVNAQSSTAASVLAVLKDSILHGGEATRLVKAPVRRYQPGVHSISGQGGRTGGTLRKRHHGIRRRRLRWRWTSLGTGTGSMGDPSGDDRVRAE